MKRPISTYYLICQIGGWVLFHTIVLLIASISGSPSHLIEKLLVSIFAGLVTTHLLRNTILKYGWLRLPLKKALPGLCLGVALTCMIAGLFKYIGNSIFAGRMTQDLLFAAPRHIFVNMIDFSLLIFPWTMIYMLYGYIEKTHKEDLERRRLEVHLKEMKQYANESGVNVDFIINSLNEIQSSIDVNPDRSRDEITKFSNLLRRGYLKL